jgi:hypothetical protein
MLLSFLWKHVNIAMTRAFLRRKFDHKTLSSDFTVSDGFLVVHGQPVAARAWLALCRISLEECRLKVFERIVDSEGWSSKY